MTKFINEKLLNTMFVEQPGSYKYHVASERRECWEKSPILPLFIFKLSSWNCLS